jgi:hypothetical protein
MGADRAMSAALEDGSTMVMAASTAIKLMTILQ